MRRSKSGAPSSRRSSRRLKLHVRDLTLVTQRLPRIRLCPASAGLAEGSEGIMEISIRDSTRLLLGRQDDRGPGPGRPDHPGQPDLHPPGAERLRQDHAPALHRRPGDARFGGDRDRRRGRLLGAEGDLCPAGEAGAGDGVPDLRDLAPHERLRQRGLPPPDPQRTQGGDRKEGRKDAPFRPARRVREAAGDEAQRRPAAARRPGPGPGRRAEGDPLRRAPVATSTPSSGRRRARSCGAFSRSSRSPPSM